MSMSTSSATEKESKSMTIYSTSSGETSRKAHNWTTFSCCSSDRSTSGSLMTLYWEMISSSSAYSVYCSTAGDWVTVVSSVGVGWMRFTKSCMNCLHLVKGLPPKSVVISWKWFPTGRSWGTFCPVMMKAGACSGVLILRKGCG